MGTNKKLIQVRLSSKAHGELKKLSQLENRSLSNMVEVLVTDGINLRLVRPLCTAKKGDLG